MSIHEQLPRQVRNELKQVGWSKATELVKVARRDQEHFESATWLHKAREVPTQQFKEEVEKYLTGASEPSELIYFKVYKSRCRCSSKHWRLRPGCSARTGPAAIAWRWSAPILWRERIWRTAIPTYCSSPLSVCSISSLPSSSKGSHRR
jgi:hypothetical protein